MSFSKGGSVMYNSICCTVFKLPGKRLLSNNSPGYLIRENNSGIIHDNISESSLMVCNPHHILSDLWGNFTYTGDNLQASQWVTNNLLIYLNSSNNINWGHNEDNTQYLFTLDGITYTKDRS